MKDDIVPRIASGQLVSYAPNSYAERTSRPIYALLFLLFFLAVFVVGTLLIQPEALRQSLAEPQVRVAAFIWIQDLMKFLGFSARGALFASPFVIIILLLSLQATSGKSWRVQWPDLLLMGVESVLLSVPLLVLTMLINRAGTPAAATSSVAVGEHYFTDIVTGIGAGIFEELVFRMILICLLMLIFQDFLGLKKTKSIVFAVVISSLLFSISHHLTYYQGQFIQTPDVFTLGKFIFRFLAGIYFAVLYATRGYGITAGTHAFYNILAALTRLFLVISAQ